VNPIRGTGSAGDALDPQDKANVRFGFAWENAVVFRAVDNGDGYRILGIHTPREIGTLVITPTGILRFRKLKREKNAKPEETSALVTLRNKCRGCGFPIAPEADYCGECACEEDGL
jgi:hypothetical protein